MVKLFGVSSAGARADVGTTDLHVQAERLVADFVGTEDAMIVGMGFATNSTTLPALVSKGCLVISDELNHASIRFGARLSNSMVRQYKHNDMEDLENLLRECVSQGQPRTHRPWKKILIIVEGLYSMEGTLVDLPRILELKEQYKVSFLWIISPLISFLTFPPGRSSSSSLTKPTLSVPWDLMDEESVITSTLIPVASTFSWVPSPNVCS